MASNKPRRDLTQRFRALPTGAKAQLVWRLLRDRRTPTTVKLIIPGVAAYVLSPVDIIPDFIPVLGQLDDIALIMLAVALLIRLTPERLLQEHIERLEAELPQAS